MKTQELRGIACSLSLSLSLSLCVCVCLWRRLWMTTMVVVCLESLPRAFARAMFDCE